MDAFIIDAVRTPRGKGRPGGALQGVKPIELLRPLYGALATRNNLDTSEVDDVILGCVTESGEQGSNIAKISALYAGWSDRISGATANRFCASALEACHNAAAKVATGMSGLIACGGVESMSRVPMLSDGGAWFQDRSVAEKTGFVFMGLSADLLATLEGIGREELDVFAVESHHRAAAARDAGRFARSLVPVLNEDGSVMLDRDESIRKDSSKAKLAALSPAFSAVAGDSIALGRYPQLKEIQHVHHVGSSPAPADAASLLLVGNQATATRLGLRPRARIRAFADHSVEPVLMLSGNVEATRKAVARAGLSVKDIDLFEVNESFAAVPLHYMRALELPDDRVNVNGGAIALGHPLGATGGILLATLIDELERRQLRYGVTSICAGAGIAAATVIERV